MKKMNERIRYAARGLTAGTRARADLSLTAAMQRAERLGADIRKNREALATMAMREGYKPEDGRALYEQIERDVTIHDQLMGFIRDQQEDARASLSARFNERLDGVAARNREALGGLFRAMMTQSAPAVEIRNALSLPTVSSDTATGAYLLPKTVSDQLIRDIVEDDSILAEFETTAITGLELPRVATTDVDGDDVDDGTDAPDASVTADRLIFGRYPYSKSVPVPNSLLTDTNTAIESYISTRHQEMMRARLCKRAFDTAATGNYTHMSVYHADNKVKNVEGEDLLTGITNALADLPTRPAGVYKVALKMADWMSLIRTLANGATSLFGAPTKEILGFEPVLSNYVTKPVVGNLKTIHLNFDSAIAYETERHAKAGTTDFVLRTYFDIHIEQPELLRTVTVTPGG